MKNAWRAQADVLNFSLVLVGSIYILATVVSSFFGGGFSGILWVGIPFLLVPGAFYLAVGFGIRNRTASSWVGLLTLSVLLGGATIVLTLWWLGIIGPLTTIPLFLWVLASVIIPLSFVAPALLVATSRCFDIAVKANA